MSTGLHSIEASVQVLVIPKGLARQQGKVTLKMTVCVLPNPLFPSEINLAQWAKEVLRQFTLEVSTEKSPPPIPHVIGVRRHPNYEFIIDPTLWRRLLGSDPSLKERRPFTPSKALPYLTYNVAQVLTDLSASVAQRLGESETDFSTRDKPTTIEAQARRLAIGNIRPTVRVVDLLAQADAGVGRGGRGPGIAQAIQEIDRMFLPPGRSTAEVVEDLTREVDFRLTGNQDLVGLLRGYLDTATNVPKSLLEGNPSDQMSAVLRSLGLKASNFASLNKRLGKLVEVTTSLAKDSSRLAARETLLEQELGATFESCVQDLYLLTAPAKEENLLFSEQSESNALAAVLQEFALLPYLGLVTDCEVDLSPTQDAKAIAAIESKAGLLRVAGFGMTGQSANLAALTVSCPWTAASGQGRLRGLGSVAQARLVPNQDGTCSPKGAVLTNIETFSNVVSTVTAISTSLNSSDASVRGAAATSAQLAVPRLRTGPLSMQVQWHGVVSAAKAGAEFASATSVSANPGAGATLRNEVMYLENLFVGVRPDLRIAYTEGDRGTWLPLLARRIRFEFGPAQTEAEEKLPFREGTRQEGMVPVMRFSIPGETDLAVYRDQVFEWSGWNPSVPFPGAAREEQVINKSIDCLPARNHRYRYGASVEVALRSVLVDGSSIEPLDGDHVASLATLSDKVLSRGLAPMGSSESFRLQRYEALRAPIVALADGEEASSYFAIESVDRVFLASPSSIALPRRSRAYRYILPGEIRDIVDLDRHGVFDGGLTPRATAFRHYERSITEGSFFPSAVGPKAGGIEQRSDPVFRRRINLSGECEKRYYPDPLVKRLRLTLCRRASRGGLFAVTYVPAGGMPMTASFVHELYAPDRTWPDAAPLLLEFVGGGRKRSDVSPFYDSCRVSGEHWVKLNVPKGEQFVVHVLPEGDADELKRKHAFGSIAPLSSSLVAEAMLLTVEHLVETPLDPDLKVREMARREPGSRVASLDVAAIVDIATTFSLDLKAIWVDPIDIPSLPEPIYPRELDDEGLVAAAHVASLSRAMQEASDGVVSEAASNLISRAPAAVSAPSVRHELPDLKHRRVGYFICATGTETFERVSRESEPKQSRSDVVEVSIPATARPEPVSLREVVPAFRFHRTHAVGSGESRRESALTVILERGWWSSGPEELLAVVLADAGASGPLDGSVSCWGSDPTRLSQRRLAPLIRPEDFRASSRFRQLVSIDTPQGKRLLRLYEPEFDKRRMAWRVDIPLVGPEGVPGPFVRLALARYQPNALASLNLSEVLSADFVSLPSERHVTVKSWPGDPTRITVTLGGAVGRGSKEGGEPEISAVLKISPDKAGTVDWEPTEYPVKLERLSGSVLSEERWECSFKIAHHALRRRVCIRVEERTRYLRDSEERDPGGSETALGPLEHADEIELYWPDARSLGGA